jgi:hypothetical protein
MASLLATNANAAAAAPTTPAAATATTTTTTTTTTTLPSEVMPLFLLRWEKPESYKRS